jgi:hypothetical protein
MSKTSNDPRELLEVLADEDAELSNEFVQDLLVAVVRLYSRRNEEDPDFLPYSPQHGVAPTDAVVLAAGLLRASDLELFELAMWNQWGRR